MVGTHKFKRPSIPGILSRRRLPSLGVGFLGYHYGYFIVTTLVLAGVIWGAHDTRGGLDFVDALFLSVSAMTLAGLNTVDLSSLNAFQQIILFLELLIGSSVFVSILIVVIRRFVFEKRFAQVATDRALASLFERDTPAVHQYEDVPVSSAATIDGQQQPTSLTVLDDMAIASITATGLHQRQQPAVSGTEGNVVQDGAPPRIKRRDLNQQARFKLGGIEYRAVYLLSLLVPAYFVLWQILPCIGLGWWIANHKAHVTLANGLNPWWVGAFNGVSAFNNSGMSLLDANMVAFQDSYYVLVTMSMMILAGNTCFPIFLRLIIWTLSKILPETESFRETKQALRFLLKHPRRCFTHLFPARHTWWLLCAVIFLNGTDWVAFEVLNIGIPEIEKLPLAARIIDGLFQALAIRSGGFYVVPIAATRVSLQALYVVMMYIGVYPVVITIRRSNEYLQRSLGIYDGDLMKKEDDDTIYELATEKKKPFWSFFGKQFKAQFSGDLAFPVFCVWIIIIIEAKRIEAEPKHFSIFNIIFEAVSGYGTVGVSTGYPGVNYSLAGEFKPLSKLIMCVIMLRGRHRGLPLALDRAVQLPGDVEVDYDANDLN